MIQLLSSCDDCFATGLKDRAYFACSLTNSISELLRPSAKQQQEQSSSSSGQPPPADSSESAKQSDENIQKTDEELKEILAVAITRKSSTIWCAVSRGDKTLSIYKLKEKDNESAIEPTLVYKTPKRVGCLSFTEFPSKVGENSTETSAVPILVAGDLAGDAYAYSLQQKRQRLLLGHTASMLTGVCIVRNRIITADRDEKIRVSSFPESYVIEGFLFGHLAYVTSIDSVAEDAKDSLVVSCGGDKTIRLWNLDTMQQISELPISEDDNDKEGGSSELIPTDVTIDPDGGKVAVIFDQSNRIDVYKVESGSTEKATLTLVQSLVCPSEPLCVTFQNKDTLLVLMREPDFLIAYKVEEDTIAPAKTDAVEKMKQEASEKKIVMPETILEKDNYGQPKLKKLQETRTVDADAPWNRVERIDIAKERNRRARKRKLLEKQS
jgi:tRNA (guanine-N(7)-)-methyltransferase subunit TRM82